MNSDDLFTEVTPDQILQEREETGNMELELSKAMEKLTPDKQLCLGLYYTCGRTCPAIARNTGMKLSTIKSHLQRGRKMIRRSMEGY